MPCNRHCSQSCALIAGHAAGVQCAQHASAPMQVPAVMPPANKPNPAMGVRTLAMSPTGRYLATVSDSQRAAVWLWDLHALSLACVLKHEQPVACLMWDPVRDKLAICTASRRCAAALLPPSPRPCTGSVVNAWTACEESDVHSLPLSLSP